MLDLILQVESALLHFSTLELTHCFMSIYENLLLLYYNNNDYNENFLYGDINATIRKHFENPDRKYYIPNKETYTLADKARIRNNIRFILGVAYKKQPMIIDC